MSKKPNDIYENTKSDYKSYHHSNINHWIKLSNSLNAAISAAYPASNCYFAEHIWVDRTQCHPLYASSQLRKHVIHATAVESTRGWRISKQKAANKIDGIVALVMATLQAVQNRHAGPMIIAAIWCYSTYLESHLKILIPNQKLLFLISLWSFISSLDISPSLLPVKYSHCMSD